VQSLLVSGQVVSVETLTVPIHGGVVDCDVTRWTECADTDIPCAFVLRVFYNREVNGRIYGSERVHVGPSAATEAAFVVKRYIVMSDAVVCVPTFKQHLNIPVHSWPCTCNPSIPLPMPPHLWIQRRYTNALLWPPYGIGQAIIFLPCDFYLSSVFFFPHLISAVGDWMSTTLRHMVWP